MFYTFTITYFYCIQFTLMAYYSVNILKLFPFAKGGLIGRDLKIVKEISLVGKSIKLYIYLIVELI